MMEHRKDVENPLPEYQPSVAAGDPGRKCFWGWQLTEGNRDGLAGRAERTCWEMLSWVCTKRQRPQGSHLLAIVKF